MYTFDELSAALSAQREEDRNDEHTLSDITQALKRHLSTALAIPADYRNNEGIYRPHVAWFTNDGEWLPPIEMHCTFSEGKAFACLGLTLKPRLNDANGTETLMFPLQAWLTSEGAAIELQDLGEFRMAGQPQDFDWSSVILAIHNSIEKKLMFRTYRPVE